MERTPFHLTPLVKEILAELVRSDKALSSHEVSQYTGSRHDYVVKALMRMQRCGWVHVTAVPPPFAKAVFELEDQYRPQAQAIVERQT